MESVEKELGRLESKSNLSKSIEDVDNIIQELRAARTAVEKDPQSAQKRLLQAQTPIKHSFEKVNENLKDVYNGLNKYTKAVKEKFKEKPLPFTENDNISTQPTLINRAVAMHLLREGLFHVATTFISEANANPPNGDASSRAVNRGTDGGPDAMDSSEDASSEDQSLDAQPWSKAPFSQPHQPSAWDTDFSPLSLRSTDLQQKFSTMYSILSAMRTQHNLGPAITWARNNSALLDARGSNLAFELCRLQYITLFMSDEPNAGPLAAASYARATFPQFPSRYQPQIKQLAGALAYSPHIRASPYADLFSSTSTSPQATATAAAAFTSEFCALLSLSSASPLLTAVTAGCIALPTLQKFSAIQAAVRTSWTTSAELPVEVPLPPSYVFHSVFVCPVSKEQATDRNPPMMMPCGHVVAKESLEGMSVGRRFKCPYCPREMLPTEATRIYL